MQKRIHELKAGDIVLEHGCRLRIIADATESCSHRPVAAHLVEADGPSACAWADAVCLDGEVQGYIRPGSNWTFQGNFYAPLVHVE